MQEAKHTPGPWRLGEIRDDQIDIDAKRHGALARVAWLMDEDKLLGKNSPEQEANARLIAAAPELLEALEDLECEASAELDPTTSLNIAIECARAAIAKATAAESGGV